MITLVFAIAIGWSLYQVASSLGYFVITAFQKAEAGNTPDTALSFTVSSHVLYFDPVLEDLVTLAVVLVVALFVQRRFRSA